MKALTVLGLLGVLASTGQMTPINTTWAAESAPAAANPQGASDLLKTETLGGLTLGSTESAVIAALGRPAKAREERWEADGAYHQDWHYPNKGATIGMVSAKAKGAKAVDSILATAGCTMTTRRGIGLGSTEKDVIAAYRDSYSKEESTPGESVVIGSTYGGLVLTLENGRVSRLFIGAAAE